LKQGAKCGKCRTPLETDGVMTAWAVPVTDADFEGKVLRSPLPVLLELVSSACSVCMKSRPVIDRLAAEWKGRVRICRMDVLANPATADRYDVMSTPTVLIFDRGKHLDTVIGVAPKEMLLQKMAPHLA